MRLSGSDGGSDGSCRVGLRRGLRLRVISSQPDLLLLGGGGAKAAADRGRELGEPTR